MLIGERLRTLREVKNLSQGDIEKRTGLLRCYLSRVENGHTVPAIETLEKLARALEIPLYQLFYDGDEPPKLPKVLKTRAEAAEWGKADHEAQLLNRFGRVMKKMGKKDRELLLFIAQKMAGLVGRRAKA